VHAGSAHHGGRKGNRRTPGCRSMRRPKAVVWARGVRPGGHGTRAPLARGDGLIGDGASGGGTVPPPAGERSGRAAASLVLGEPPCCDVATCFVAADERPIQTDRCRPPRTSDPTSHPRRSCGFRWRARRWKGSLWLGKLAPCPSLNCWCT
jgi:hypothetical protein